MTPLTATCSAGAIFWYDAAVGGNVVGSGASFTPNSTATLSQGVYTFYVICQTSDGCESENLLPVNLVVESTPVAPTIADINICEGEAAPTLTPSGTAGSSVFIFTHPDGTVSSTATASLVLVDDANGFDKDQAGTYTYQVREETSCESPVTLMTVTVDPMPMAIAGNDGAPICTGNSKTLTADNAGLGATYAVSYTHLRAHETLR